LEKNYHYASARGHEDGFTLLLQNLPVLLVGQNYGESTLGKWKWVVR